MKSVCEVCPLLSGSLIWEIVLFHSYLLTSTLCSLSTQEMASCRFALSVWNFTSDPDTFGHAQVDLSVSLQAGMFRGLQAAHTPPCSDGPNYSQTHPLPEYSSFLLGIIWFNWCHFKAHLLIDNSRTVHREEASCGVAFALQVVSVLTFLAFHMRLPPGHSPDCSGGWANLNTTLFLPLAHPLPVSIVKDWTRSPHGFQTWL